MKLTATGGDEVLPDNVCVLLLCRFLTLMGVIGCG